MTPRAMNTTSQRHIALVAMLVLSSCGVFRPLYRDWKNADLRGSVAPPLVGGTWTMRDAVTGLATVVPGGWEPPESDWRLLVFFLPG